MNKHLHIISLDIPFPPDYGGMIDVFYKLKSLAEADVRITLHCFEYGNRKPAAELQKYCKQIYYYPRKTGLSGLHATLPYIVSSRNDNSLLRNLLQDEAPILFEGLHSTFFADHPLLQHRNKIVRAHNIESDYYSQLAKNSQSFFKKLYYSWEANRLMRYENEFRSATYILAISKADAIYLAAKYPATPVHYVPAFHGVDDVTSVAGSGSYCLYHGNLSVAENIKSVMFLAQEIFKDLQIPLIIAGKNPSHKILQLSNGHIQIIANPTQEVMEDLIRLAHIHVLPAFQQTGIKLKLLHALFAGRFCITNDEKIEQPLIEHVHISKTATEFRIEILRLMMQEFKQQDVDKRKELFRLFSNETGAKIIIDLL